MSILDTLITDRTQADADRAAELVTKGLNGMTPAELAEYLAGMKGAYNATDLNRVSEAVEYVAGQLRRYGYRVELQPAQVWTMTDIPTQADMDIYLGNLRTVRMVLNTPGSMPEVPPDMDGLTWQEANDIERILTVLDSLLTLMTGSFLRCGAAGVVCGARGLPTEGGYFVRTWAELDAEKWGWPEWDEKTWTQLSYRRR